MKRLGLLALIGALAASGCSRPSREQSDLEAARERWEKAAISTYSYDIVLRCFCPTLDATVQVVDGVVVSSVPASRNSHFPRTVDELFADLERELASEDRGAYTIEFDPELGYPRRVSADPIELAIDDEYGYEIVLVSR
jgi:hypothetical protein